MLVFYYRLHYKTYKNEIFQRQVGINGRDDTGKLYNSVWYFQKEQKKNHHMWGNLAIKHLLHHVWKKNIKFLK